jgi:hypothetical protein
MAIATDLLPMTCDVYRPFGDAAPTASGIPCRLVPDLARGRRPEDTGLAWTHYLVLGPTADVRDGCTRAAGAQALTYADGDEVRVSGARFAVVWVERIEVGTPREYQRAYLMRHAA